MKLVPYGAFPCFGSLSITHHHVRVPHSYNPRLNILRHFCVFLMMFFVLLLRTLSFFLPLVPSIILTWLVRLTLTFDVTGFCILLDQDFFAFFLYLHHFIAFESHLALGCI